MIDGRIPIANIYYLLCYAWRHLEESDLVRLEALDSIERIHDLLGRLLAAGTFRLIRRGLDRGYEEIQEDVAGIRGKINVGQTVKRALRARAQVACEYEELSHDVVHNRILRATLKSLLKIRNLHSDVRIEVRRAYTKLEGISEVALSRHLFQQVQLDRNRRYYRFLLAVCLLIHESLLVNERTGEVRFIDFSNERMHKLYEDFIIEFYRCEQDCYEVNPRGRKIAWVDEGTPERYQQNIPEMEADVVLEAPDRRIIMDAKYYQDALGGRFGGKLHSDNLYQLLAYLRNREATETPGPKHEGILLYPTVDESVNIVVRLEGFSIQARSIDLAQSWQEIYERMLAVIGADSLTKYSERVRQS